MLSTEGEQNEILSNQDEVITCRLKKLDASTIQAEKQIYEARKSKHRNIKLADWEQFEKYAQK